MKKQGKNEKFTRDYLSDLLIGHYSSRPPCDWGVIIKFSPDFGFAPLSKIYFFHDLPCDIKTVTRILRTNSVPVLNVQKHDALTHIITLMNHSTEN